MFKINARTDYGLMIMCELAKNPKKTIAVSGLAKRLGSSSVYLIQIAKPLLAAGFIKSKEGSGGGYFLAQAANKISLLDILEALDGKIATRCDSGASCCSQAGHCTQRSLWGELLNDFKKTLRRKSLASLVK